MRSSRVRHGKAIDLMRVQPREIGLIERVITGQAEAPHLVGKAEAAINLHGAGVLTVALGMPARVWLGVEDRALGAVIVEQQREYEADGTAADDRDRRVCLLGTHAGCLRRGGKEGPRATRAGSSLFDPYAASIATPACSHELATSDTVARCMSRFQRRSSKLVPRCMVHRLSQITRSWTRQRWV